MFLWLQENFLIPVKLIHSGEGWWWIFNFLYIETLCGGFTGRRVKRYGLMQYPVPHSPFVASWLHSPAIQTGLVSALRQARDHDLQASLISTWLSEGSIGTCTSSGCCRPTVLIWCLQEMCLCQETSAGGSTCGSYWQLSPASAGVKGAAMMCKGKVHCASSPILAKRVKWKVWSGKCEVESSSGDFDRRTF